MHHDVGILPTRSFLVSYLLVILVELVIVRSTDDPHPPADPSHRLGETGSRQGPLRVLEMVAPDPKPSPADSSGDSPVKKEPGVKDTPTPDPVTDTEPVALFSPGSLVNQRDRGLAIRIDPSVPDSGWVDWLRRTGSRIAWFTLDGHSIVRSTGFLSFPRDATRYQALEQRHDWDVTFLPFLQERRTALWVHLDKVPHQMSLPSPLPPDVTAWLACGEELSVHLRAMRLEFLDKQGLSREARTIVTFSLEADHAGKDVQLRPVSARTLKEVSHEEDSQTKAPRRTGSRSRSL